ncbi:MAG TPA: LytTR family DNA-binding domain-containing protein [Usitatibacter sp.]|jgi:DNA-binding LytR/AlgR family response regulator|nr:LytTR family DNA-binding domain-containing protein [Usitatibacter sp.]
MKAVVAEDEALLRGELVSLLRETWPGLEIIACEDGGAAVEAIDEHHPDVAFLDIRMPGLTGLEVAAAAAEASPSTQVVFVTAYNQYAIDAFDRGAVDYLLKPISRERLSETVKRVKARAAAGGADPAALAALVDKLRDKLPAESRKPPLAWITANVGKETRLILVDDIAYFQADNKYTVVMTGDGEALIRKTIRELLDELDPAIFKQIHRSTIVNMRAIAAVTRDESGRGTIRLKSRRETLPVSLTFMPIFRSM